MYTTREYLRADPWQAVINCINDLYLTELTAYSTKLVSIESLGGTSTKIVVKPDITNSDQNTMPPVERTEYIYDRLDLATFFTNGTQATLGGFRLPTSTFKVLDQISELNDIVFTLNDFVHAQYDEYEKTYTLKANPKSLRFIGEFKFKLVNTTKALLQNKGTKVEFPDANPGPLGNIAGKMIGQYLTSGYDFTNDRDYLVTLDNKSNWPNGRKLAAIIQNTTGYEWVCTGQTVDWNIAYELNNGEPRVNIIYNGIVLPRYSPRSDIQRVCVLRLSGLANNVSGYLLLHYN